MLIKKLLFILLLVIFLAAAVSVNAYALEENDVSAHSAILISTDTNETLFEKNADARRSMASTTKIMTSVLVLEALTPEREITVTKEMVSVEGTSMGLLPGDAVSMKTLVYGMLLASGNDAANVSAYILGGGQAGFSVLMNEKAKEIGMKNTNFVTPSGLDSEKHYSTARDMAALASYALKSPEFVKISSSSSATVSYGNPPYQRRLHNHNRLLSMYDGTIGVKTGFTKKSGRCLVSAAERDGITLVAVTLNAPSDWGDHVKMFEYGFSAMSRTELPHDFTGCRLNVAGGVKDTAGVEAAYAPYFIHSADIPEISEKIYINNFCYAPVEAGKAVGYCEYTDAGGNVLASVPIVTAEAVEIKEIEDVKEKDSIIKKMKNFLNRLNV